MTKAQTTVTSGSPTTLTATIANGASLSDAQNVDGRLCGLITPAAWTAAAITFSASYDGINYADVWELATGTAVERIIASVNITTAAAKYFALPLSDWLSAPFIKIRSGTSASPVNQGAARSIVLVMAG